MFSGGTERGQQHEVSAFASIHSILWAEYGSDPKVFPGAAEAAFTWNKVFQDFCNPEIKALK